MTQHDTIIKMLQQGGTVCGSEFLSVYLPTYSQRIGELKKKGYRIYRVECPHDWHNHTSNIATYELARSQGGSHDDPQLHEIVEARQLAGRDEPPIADNFDEVYAEMKEREPEREPPDDDEEDTFHTNIVWPDDEADHGHDSAVDQAAGEGLG